MVVATLCMSLLPSLGGVALSLHCTLQAEGKGKGLFARALIPKGALVIEYCGELIDENEYDRRLVQYKVTRWQLPTARRRPGVARPGDVHHTCDDAVGRRVVALPLWMSAWQGWKHFYTFQLGTNRGKKEYIDATLKGSIARYINHSCDPNATSEIRYVTWCGRARSSTCTRCVAVAGRARGPSLVCVPVDGAVSLPGRFAVTSASASSR